MTDSNNEHDNNMEDESFAELFEAYESKAGRELSPGDRVDGTIISIGEQNVYVDTGTKSDGVVEKSELLDENGEITLKTGDMITLYVVSSDESEILLSKAMSGAGKVSMLKDASRNRTPVEGKITAAIKGGVQVDIMGKRAFCPASQVDIKYVEDMEEHVGKTYNFLITRFEEGGKNIVVSRRDLLNEEVKERVAAFFKETQEGDIVKGTVTRLMSYGAFVELVPGLEGMVHVSELSWSRVENAADVVQPGDQLNVKILKTESGEKPGTYKISLSVKQVSESPWENMDKTFNVGDQVPGKVVRLANFGAFVEIAPGVDGLVHISEMSHTKRVIKPDDVVQTGDRVQVVVKSIDMESRRVSLSIKDALGDPWTGVTAKYETNAVVEGIVEKKESFGLFIQLEPGITGLMPNSNISNAEDPALYEGLKPKDNVMVMVTEVDEDKRRITLASPEQKDGGDWKQYAAHGKKKSKGSMGTMESLFLEAMKKKK